MKKALLFTVILGLSVLGLSGCPGDSANTTNANRTNTNINSNANMNANMRGNVNANSNTAIVQDNFWTNAARGGMAEVELSKVAATKAQNAEVKKFAQMMITDHTKANTELKALAEKKGVTLPTDLDSSHKDTLEELNGLSGADFDKAYVEAMVDDHETVVDLMEDNADNSDADIKAFAAKTLPIVKGHLDAIKAIQGKLK